jgi:hypothetical protein
MKNKTKLQADLEKHGLETHPGCAVDLFESVRFEYGEDVAKDVIKYFSDVEVMKAVHNALLTNRIID